MRQDMKAAYTLISDYKAGKLEQGSEITPEQQRLIRLLAKDLEVQEESCSIEALVSLVARADSHWNRQTMSAVDQFYTVRGSEGADKAEAVRIDFLGRCPSVWYCAVLTNL